MQVLYYTPPLLQGGKLALDPANLSTLQQYYLLENLAVGLVRDDDRSKTGYVPGLTKSWSRNGPKTWSFELAEDLRWSDGSTIDPAYVAAEILRLKDSKSRHLRILRHLADCGVTRGTRLITLRFDAPVDSWLLHELSLADATLLHPRNRNGDWSVTSGPYAVSSWNADQREIVLRRNSWSSVAAVGAPETVRLFWVKNPEELETIFQEKRVDIFPTLANVFSRRQVLMSHAATETLWSLPTTLQMFRFNWQNADSMNAALRRAFAALVHRAFKGWKIGDMVEYDPQLIPTGHKGRLQGYEAISLDQSALAGRTLRLQLPTQARELTGFSETLLAAAKQADLRLDLTFEESRLDASDTSTFATLYAFKGNQKDALGNWSFLFSADGPFHPFEERAEPLFDTVATAPNDGLREEALEKIHRLVLDEAMGVPVFFESSAIFSSGRYDLSRLNRYDLRPRFFCIFN